MSKTKASQVTSGQQSYYYWHSDAERRRKLGEEAAPLPPEPKKLGSEPVAQKTRQTKAVASHYFMDDGDVVKVYIPLEGELAGTSMDNVEVEFADRTLQVCIVTPDTFYRFTIERLAHEVHAPRCKARVVKSGKLLLTLHKRNHIERWGTLRAPGR